MTDVHLKEHRRAIWLRRVRALQGSLCSPNSLDDRQATLVGALTPEAITMLGKVFRTLYVVEPSNVNLYRYLKKPSTFVADLAYFSVKVNRNQVENDELLTDSDLKAIPRVLEIASGA